ncbi:hypothetical protein [Holophaga foetida]|uniref:hypothetical protein n=1 Tax=Holophaga foetida TaxID=35839 RepID=UPI0002474CF2|nr:hypothetical protein [Holophaga foetida]
MDRSEKLKVLQIAATLASRSSDLDGSNEFKLKHAAEAVLDCLGDDGWWERTEERALNTIR